MIHLLTLLFVALKLTGHIDWSWFWVVFPSLVPLILVTFVALVGAATYTLKGK